MLIFEFSDFAYLRFYEFTTLEEPIFLDKESFLQMNKIYLFWYGVIVEKLLQMGLHRVHSVAEPPGAVAHRGDVGHALSTYQSDRTAYFLAGKPVDFALESDEIFVE